MAFGTFAFGESVLNFGTLQPLAAIPDDTAYASGDDLVVPQGLQYIAAYAHISTFNSVANGRLSAPSLRAIADIDVLGGIVADNFTEEGAITLTPRTGRQLQPYESLNFLSSGGGDGTTAADVYGLVWLSDGPIQPVEGPITSVHVSVSGSPSKFSWSKLTMSFDQTLPAGRYQVVGATFAFGNCKAARLIFPGQPWRPGVPVVDNRNSGAGMLFRMGRFGVFGEFSPTIPPQLEAIGGNAPPSEGILDLIKVQ